MLDSMTVVTSSEKQNQATCVSVRMKPHCMHCRADLLKQHLYSIHQEMDMLDPSIAATGNLAQPVANSLAGQSQVQLFLHNPFAL